MDHTPHGELVTLYEQGWNYSQDSTFAVDTATGNVVDVNPAAVALMGYTRDELIGMHVTRLHPEAEWEQVNRKFDHVASQPSSHSGLHIQRKDGSIVPVAIWSSTAFKVEGRSLKIAEFRDISEFEQQQHRLRTKRWALVAYAGAAVALGKSMSVEDLLNSICEAITRESAYALAFVANSEDTPANPTKQFPVAAAAGSALGYLEGLYHTWDEADARGRGPLGICMRTGELQIMQDIESFPAFAPWLERARQFGIRSGVIIPVPMEKNRRIALAVYAGHANAFEPVALEVFQYLANEMGHGIHAIEQQQLLVAEREYSAKVQSQLTQTLSAMVAPIVLAMEMRDPYTTGHQARVADIAVAIAHEMKWSEERVQGLRVAAQVHDIGKISIPAEILTKPGALNAAERGMINGHAEIGYTILKDIPFAWPIAEIVRQHHEKLDGSGYPKGLKSDQILPEAKILTVADIVDAMGSHRPYRPGVELPTVLSYIQEQAGSALDPETVRICITLFRQKRLKLSGRINR